MTNQNSLTTVLNLFSIKKIKDRWLQNKANQLIWESVIENWRLILVNFATNIIGALFEGGTFGIIFLAVTLLSEPRGIDWSRYAVLSSLPWLSAWLNSLGTGTLFVLLLGVAVSTQILLGISTYFNSVTAGELGVALQVKFTEYLHRLILSFSFACASRYKIGDLGAYTSSAGPTVKTQITLINGFLCNFFLLLIYLSILVIISPWLLLAAIALAFVFYAIQKQLLPRIRQTAIGNEQDLVEISKQVTENLQGLRLLHTAGRQSTMIRRVNQLIAEVTPGLKRQIRLLNLTQPIAQTLPVVMLAIITSLAYGLFAQRSTGILPSLVTFVLALQRFNIRLQGVSGTFTGLAANSGSLKRFHDILDPRDKEFERQGGVAFGGLQGDVEFRQVSLRYQQDQGPVLRDINVSLPFGKVTALVGQSGAGKSSLADLLIGLYEPSEGAIWVNGQDLREFDPVSWRQRLGVVSQDIFLFNASILDNIRFTCPGAPDSDVIQAALAAQADAFIRELPMGYGTVVGERGYRLSGGQRQRLALARAILSNPDILILDEATSALDTVSERLVQQALDDFGKSRTVLVIAHRLSTIINADQIVVMEQGNIVERGTHSELLRLSGLYHHAWQLQSRQQPTLEAKI